MTVFRVEIFLPRTTTVPSSNEPVIIVRRVINNPNVGIGIELNRSGVEEYGIAISTEFQCLTMTDEHILLLLLLLLLLSSSSSSSSSALLLLLLLLLSLTNPSSALKLPHHLFCLPSKSSTSWPSNPARPDPLKTVSTSATTPSTAYWIRAITKSGRPISKTKLPGYN